MAVSLVMIMQWKKPNPSYMNDEQWSVRTYMWCPNGLIGDGDVEVDTLNTFSSENSAIEFYKSIQPEAGKVIYKEPYCLDIILREDFVEDNRIIV